MLHRQSFFCILVSFVAVGNADLFGSKKGSRSKVNLQWHFYIFWEDCDVDLDTGHNRCFLEMEKIYRDNKDKQDFWYKFVEFHSLQAYQRKEVTLYVWDCSFLSQEYFFLHL